MNQMLKLRSYQQEALDAIELSLLSHTRVACVLPTGAGKTVLFAHLIDKAHREGKKALVLVHREELAEQAKAKVHSVAPRLSVGIVKAARNEVDADVIIASVQTLARFERRMSVSQAGDIGIVIVDECHHAVAKTWMEVLSHFGCFYREDAEAAEVAPEESDRTPCVGFTATLTRQDGKGLGDVWETVAYERDILWMIDNGYLTDVRGQSVTVDDLDLATIARSRGDYVEGQLGEALIASGAAEVTAKAYIEHATSNDERGAYHVKQGVLFAPTVASAYAFAEAFNEVGIPTETVEGNISSEDRALIYKRYETGEITVLANCMVLSEGWDAPWAEVAVIARPTSSASLYTQMVGRVLRPWPNKDEALVLDVVGIAGRHKLQSLTDLVKTTVLDGESYAEARVRLEQEAQDRIGEPGKMLGQVFAKQVELFANSHSTWLQTRGGRWFIPVSGGLFFLWPEDDGKYWRLGYIQQGKKPATYAIRKNGWIEEGMTLEYAMAWGEQLAELDDPTVSLKDRKWRKTKPSEAQIAYALRIKCVEPEMAYAMRKGELSDVISVHLASKQLDR
jgi:superfamily II DNA or RNA helicase